MLTVRLYREGKIEEEGFDPARISDLLEEGGTLVWLDLEDPTDEELALIQEEFSLHPLAIEDAHHRHQRPKVEDYAGPPLRGVLRDRAGRRGPPHERGSRLRRAGPPDHPAVRARARPGPGPQAVGAPYGADPRGGRVPDLPLLDEVVDGYFDVVEGLEAASEEIEEGVFGDVESSRLQQRMFELKKQLLEVRSWWRRCARCWPPSSRTRWSPSRSAPTTGTSRTT